MSSPTSAMQLLGGLLSPSPSANTAMPMQSGAALVAAPSGDPGGFYTLWMGMSAQGQLMPLADEAARQKLVMEGVDNGIKLPPETAEQLLQNLDQLLQQVGDDDTDLIESAVELLRLGLQQAEPDKEIVLDESGTLADADVSDADLLEYLKALLESPTDVSEAGPSTSRDDPLPLSQEAKHTLISYLEQKLAAPETQNPVSAQPSLPEALSTEEMAEAERMVRQLWAELETARRARTALQAETGAAEDRAKASDGVFATLASDQAQAAAMASAGRQADSSRLAEGEYLQRNRPKRVLELVKTLQMHRRLISRLVCSIRQCSS
ncbi:hypothetical protein LH51_12870 [Nitrincola sp. A-D6]|uniref:hypothetical protein n=1 Tax=Nitrincola sp. A-D6 TaxID=1545442 RepID=UPI00051FE973|nr:hypothetical protein [Nitrincola sp. A-D6]KGK41688.1 hypothetical protein LH51_12870 [Nitrincola sp. A-D6]